MRILVFITLGFSLAVIGNGCTQPADQVAEDAGLVLEEARTFLSKEQYEEAESTLVALSKQSSLSATGLELLGRAKAGLFDDEGAINSFQNAIQLDGDRVSARIALVQALRRNGQLQEAIAQIEKANLPDNVQLGYESGQISMQEGRFDDAAQQFEQIVASDSTFLDAYYALGSAYQRLGREAEGEAVLARYEALSSAAQDVKLDAQIVDLNPNSAEAHYNLARAYEQQGENEQALDFYMRALSINKNLPEAYNNMGIIYFKTNQDEMAVKAFNSAIALSDTTAKYYFNLGAVYARRGVLSEAEKLWRKTLEIDPDYEKATQFLSQLPASN